MSELEIPTPLTSKLLGRDFIGSAESSFRLKLLQLW